MTPGTWLRYQQDLALAAFVVGCTMAELALRVSMVPVHSMPLVHQPRLRLVSDLYGIEVDPDFVKDKSCDM